MGTATRASTDTPVIDTPAIDSPPEVLAALAEPLRWRIAQLLAREELCVCHLVEELGVGQPLVSHHLRILREAGLVTGERWRYWTYYRLQPGAIEQVAAQLTRAVAGPPARTRRPCC